MNSEQFMRVAESVSQRQKTKDKSKKSKRSEDSALAGTKVRRSVER